MIAEHSLAITTLVDKIKHHIHQLNQKITVLEVCGTHTASIHKYGLHSLFREEITFLSGPGCPVCVTHPHFIDELIKLSQNHTIFSFGDMLRVPGSQSSLAQARANGADIRIMYSPLDAVEQAAALDKNAIIAAVGFETTTPAFALAAQQCLANKIGNIFFVNELKSMPEPLTRLFMDGISVDGILLPGHVATITGANAFSFMQKYAIPCVIAGFTINDLLISLYMLTTALLSPNNTPPIMNQYTRVVTPYGNTIAQKLVSQYYEPCPGYFRGFGLITASGRRFLPAYQHLEIPLTYPPEQESSCLCAQIVTAKARPNQCPLFAKICTPDSPQGACMVSAEGACSTYYKYAREGND